jgi:hypothetical protein
MSYTKNLDFFFKIIITLAYFLFLGKKLLYIFNK